MSTLDSRLHAFRADLADSRLQGVIDAARFCEGEIREVSIPIASVRRGPVPDAMQTTQALLGERCRVFEVSEGWAWVQLEADGYVGYIAESALGAAGEATHRVSVPMTFIYPAPDIKSQPVTPAPMAARLAVRSAEGKFARLASGFILMRHIAPIDSVESDFVSVAELFRHAPYLWGGKSVAGLDCSGLVQVALASAGIPCPRDTDMQEKALGTPVASGEKLRRGDLVFWNGHVGIMTSATDLLHANGHHMLTVIEPLAEAVARIGPVAGGITAIKRL
ncbi:MAG: NlpC/P60 family protein [Hyphomicrobiales bacterium]